jgi:hypothetical protein
MGQDAMGGMAGPLYSGGINIGSTLNGFVYIPFSLACGIIMQDANGVNWLLQIGTDGRLSTGVQVTF